MICCVLCVNLQALETRFEQESAQRKRFEADTAISSGRLRQVELDLRTCETKLRIAAEQEVNFEKRRNEAIARRKADEIGRKMAEQEVAELAPRVRHCCAYPASPSQPGKPVSETVQCLVMLLNGVLSGVWPG